MSSKSVTETCQCSFFQYVMKQIVIKRVCDFENKFKIALWLLSLLFVCSKSDMNTMQKILSPVIWGYVTGRVVHVSLKDHCAFICREEGLLNCVTLKMMALLSFGVLGAAHQTAQRWVSE